MGDVNKLRILALHGYHQSDTVFSAKLGSLRKYFKKNVEFVFVKAPHEVSQFSNPDEEDVPNIGYGWWFNTEDKYFKATEPSDLCVGFEDSVSVIKKKFEESGPFDGLIGFSQGAAFVTVLCAMQQKKELPIKFDFAILVSGFKSLCKPHQVYYDEKIDLPTLHVYGTDDKIIPVAMTEELSEFFVSPKKVVHEGGHYVPSKKHIYNDFIQEMLCRKTV